jgi:hypothetical protein
MRTAKYRELAWELRNETLPKDKWEIRIDGRIWKALTGKEYNIKAMCERKTLETGKAWTAHPCHW